MMDYECLELRAVQDFFWFKLGASELSLRLYIRTI